MSNNTQSTQPPPADQPCPVDPILESPERLVNASVAADFFGISERSIRRLRQKWGLRPIYIGRRCLYRVDDLKRVSDSLNLSTRSQHDCHS